MSKTRILDCTLRDGGYINDFAFGERGISSIISKLTLAGIDIVECGFLEDCDYDPNDSVYDRVEQIVPFIPRDRGNTLYVAMACFGEYDLNKLSPYDGQSIDGIRVTFHYNEIEPALNYCKRIISKGYKVFIQPVGTTSYSDEKLLALIHEVNKLRPYAFYFVDTLGLMDFNEVKRFFYIINHNLHKTIHLGFHSHNNLQLSFSNCQALSEVETDRDILLDSSVYGMGRGAGNMNTELIAKYLNDHKHKQYEIEPILEIIDEHILKIKEQFEWGYSVPYYLAAINGCHPNYASYLMNKQTLTIRNISSILHMIEVENRALFNKKLIEEKYIEYQSHDTDDGDAVEELKESISGRNVLVLAPGSSLKEYKQDICQTIIDSDCIVIAVSFIPDFIEPDFVFLSNVKRYKTTFNPLSESIKLIYTSNIHFDKEERRPANSIVVNYSSLLNDSDFIRDNAAMMLLNLLIKIMPGEVLLAGLDGYRIGADNYYQQRLDFSQCGESYLIKNQEIKNKIASLSRVLRISFVTPSLYK